MIQKSASHGRTNATVVELWCSLKSAAQFTCHTSGIGDRDTCCCAGFGDRDTSEWEDDMSDCRLSPEGFVSKGLSGLLLASRTCSVT